MGRNSTLQNQYGYTSQTMAEAVQAGDFVVNTPVGNCWADGSTLRPISLAASSALDTIVERTIGGSYANNASTGNNLQTAVFVSGATSYIAVAWADSGAKLMFSIYNADMSVAIGPTQVDATSIVGDIAITAINGGKFMIVYATSNNVVKWAEYNTGGAVVSSGTVDSVSAAVIRIAQSTSGNVCIATSAGYTQAVRYTIITPGSGAIVLASKSVSGTIGIGQYFLKSLSVIALENGNFSIAYVASGNNQGTYMGVISQTGTIVSPFRSVVGYGVAGLFSQRALTGGGFAILSWSDTDYLYYLHTFNSVGTQIGGGSLGFGTGTANVPAVVEIVPTSIAGETLCFATTSNSFVTLRRSDINGNAIAGTTIQADTTANRPLCTSTFSGKAALLTYINGTGELRYILADLTQPNTLTTTQSLANVRVSSQNSVSVSPIASSNYGGGESSATFAMVWTSTANSSKINVSIRSSTILKSTPLGVAIAPASSGGACTIVNSGIARIRTAVATPYSTDATARAGVRIAAMGNVCNLSTTGAAQQNRNIN